jgi:hypothetical protein
MMLEIGEKTSSHFLKEKEVQARKRSLSTPIPKGRQLQGIFFKKKLLSHSKGECWRRNK